MTFTKERYGDKKKELLMIEINIMRDIGNEHYLIIIGCSRLRNLQYIVSSFY